MSALERLPDAALDADIAILGRKGGGKTYTAKGIVERLLDMGRRVLVLDPLGVWAGLRTAADGEHDGYPIAIFGGAHADLPLDVAAAPALANVIARENLPAVIDLSELTKTAQQSFLYAFLHELRRVNSEALTIVLEEADVFAPQNPQGDDSKQLHSEIDWIARRGRFRGFRLITITQRPARLSKDVLTQCSTLIAHKLPAPQDREAVKAWVDGNGDRDRAKEVFDTLAGLSIGEAWVWAPEHEILQRMRFPGIKTLDTSSTPKAGERRIEPKTLAQVDLTGIRAALAEASQERSAARVSDPKAKSKPDQTAATSDQLREAHAEGRRQGDADATDRITAHLAGVLGALRDQAVEFVAALDVQIDMVRMNVMVIAPQEEQDFAAILRPARDHEPKPPAAAAASFDMGPLSKTSAETLSALAWWSAIGVTAPTKKQLGAMLKIDHAGSTMRARLAELSKAGMVEYPAPGTVRLTPAGKVAAPRPDRSATLLATIRDSLPDAARETFDAIPKRPGDTISKEALARKFNPPLEPGGSTLRARLADLSGRGLIEYLRMKPFTPNDWYFQIGADASQFWSSARARIVPALDADYLAFMAAGGAPTRRETLSDLRAYFGETFPAGMPASYLAMRRYQIETGGVSAGDVRVATDRESQAMISGAVGYVALDPAATVKFKLDDGSFVELDAAAVRGIALAVAQHVQKCFAAEADISAKIVSGEISSIAAVDAALSEAL